MKQLINIDTWKRKEHYNFFKDFQEPFFSITANVDCTEAYKYAKENNISFFLYYMYKSMAAINAVEELRYRIEDNEVVCYDRVHCSTTALNANNMFAFAFLPFTDSFEEFYPIAQQEIAKIKALTSMNLEDTNNARQDVIHYSTIPWVSFTSLTNERNLGKPDSIPKITFGKYFNENNRLLLPMSIAGHHGLMDGMHAGQHFQLFEQLLNEK